jgi:hypothetical protein
VINYSPNKTPRVWSLFAFLFFAFAFVSTVRAQETQSLIKSSTTSVPQDVTAKLANLPEADTIIYFNPRRILTEAAPRVMQAKDLDGMNTAFSEIKSKAGIDPRTLDYLVIASRFKKPSDDLRFMLPDFMVVVSGDFDGGALIQIAREAAKGKLREETYNSKPIHLFTIEDVAKQSEKMPILSSLSEVAIAQLNGDTIAVGTTSYVKAAVDATTGKGRISPELLSSAMRDPSVLVSTAGSPWTAFAKTFALLGTANNPRNPKCDMKLGDYYAGITMDATSFKIRGAMNADNPDTAKIIKSLLSMGLEAVISEVKDSKAQAALRGLTITPTETEVLVQADVSQQTVADFIREAAPKKDAAMTSAPATPTKPKPATRRGRRRPVKKN